MKIFLGIIAVIFMLITISEKNKDFKNIYAKLFAVSILAMLLNIFIPYKRSTELFKAA